MSYGAMMAQFGLRLATLFIPSVPPLLQPRSALIINVVIVISEETREGSVAQSLHPSVRPKSTAASVRPRVRPSAVLRGGHQIRTSTNATHVTP